MDDLECNGEEGQNSSGNADTQSQTGMSVNQDQLFESDAMEDCKTSGNAQFPTKSPNQTGQAPLTTDHQQCPKLKLNFTCDMFHVEHDM